MNRTRVTILVTACLLSACAIAPSRVSFYDAPDASELATKPFTRSDGWASWDEIKVISMDNKFIGDLYNGGKLRVSPGPHVLVSLMRFNRGADSGGPFEALVTLKVDLAPSKHYALNGDISAGNANVWLEDIPTGERVGEVASAPWGIDHQRVPTAIPVFVPHR